MGRDIRTFRTGAIVYVTNRTYHDQLRLTPSPAVNLIVRGCLIRASEWSGVPLVTASVMGNHFELLAASPIARLDDLMEYFEKEVSHRLNRMRGVEHSNFPRRYSYSELAGREECERKIAQILCNPVRAGLVYQVDDWPGFSTLAAHRAGETSLESRHLSRPEAGALDEHAELPDWVESCSVVETRLHRPEFAADMTDSEWHAHVVELVSAEEARLQRELDREDRRTLGPARILQERWTQRPEDVQWKRYRRCIADDESISDAYDDYYEETEKQYKSAARTWRLHGRWNDYPPGTFPPGWLWCLPTSAEVGPPLPWMQTTGPGHPGGDRPPPRD